MNTTKMPVRLLADLCLKHGMRKVVFSPGSRSAPIYIAFSQIPDIECIVIPDERVAGYFALGMAQQSRELVGVVCTSGTAVLNFAPSVYEANYQGVRLIYITADRPKGAEELKENQAIDQHEPFGLDAMQTICFHGEKDDPEELGSMVGEFEDEIDFSKRYNSPIHINVHMDEPLYELTDAPLVEVVANKEEEDDEDDEDTDFPLINKKSMKKDFTGFAKKMIIVGLHDSSKEFTRRLTQLSHRKDTVIIRETTSNIAIKNSIANVEATLSSSVDEIQKSLLPELVITLGGRVTSKRLGKFLKGNDVREWNIENTLLTTKVYGIHEPATHDYFQCTELELLDIIIGTPETESSAYREEWMKLSSRAKALTETFMNDTPFSDLKVFEMLIQSFPNDANIQYGNSTPVRYSNLFRHQTPGLTVNANRGTSGIDGCISTAAGAAYMNKRMTVSIVGDISFFYDSNALWNNFLSPDFRIIMINNSGGNIFRLIDGPAKLKGFEEFFETKHNMTARLLAQQYSIPYYYCDNQNDLAKILETFYEPQDGRPAILEIKTNGEVSAEVYKKYFDYLQQNA